ncbi:MAG: hypothetical protein QXO74_00140 [Candidatus Methanomethylicia archaeon]
MFEKAIKLGDIFLYRNAVDKAFLSMVLAVNSYIHRKLNVTPRSHSGRRASQEDRAEDLRAVYSDVMKTLHEEALYNGVYKPDEAEYAIKQVEKILKDLKEG